MSYQDLKTSIENNCCKASSGIYTCSSHIIYNSAGARAGKTSAMVLGEAPPKPEILKRRLAKARQIALEQMKLVSATVLVVDRGYYDRTFGEFKNIAGSDGRILGMTMKLTASGGLLPMGAAFIIKDPPEVEEGSDSAGSGVGGRKGTTGASRAGAEVSGPCSMSSEMKTSLTALGNSLLQALIKEGWTPPSGSNIDGLDELGYYTTSIPSMTSSGLTMGDEYCWSNYWDRAAIRGLMSVTSCSWSELDSESALRALDSIAKSEDGAALLEALLRRFEE